MIKNNPAPDLDLVAGFYIRHLLNLLTEGSEGVIPILKVYEYCSWWGIENPLEFGDIITEASRYVYENISKRQNSGN